MTTRRDFLNGTAVALVAALPAKAATNWNAGSVIHLLPAVNHNRILIKASFEQPPPAPPRLRAGGKSYAGQRTDARGAFWAFDATGLEPARPYELEIVGAGGKRLCDPWPLKTFPAPSEQPQRLRLLIYSCAGGHDALKQPDGRS